MRTDRRTEVNRRIVAIIADVMTLLSFLGLRSPVSPLYKPDVSREGENAIKV